MCKNDYSNVLKKFKIVKKNVINAKNQVGKISGVLMFLLKIKSYKNEIKNFKKLF